MDATHTAVGATVKYFSAMFQWVFAGKGYSEDVYFNDDIHARVQVYSLALIFTLWSEKHYRCASFQQDMLDNLRNVAIPGTGIPLSLFCHSWWLCFMFVLICGLRGGGLTALSKHYIDHLFHPVDWFSFWRLNCRLVSWHSLLLKPKGYTLEDKWAFLKHGESIGVPVSPFMHKPQTIVVKNKNIEGGMGIHFFQNAVHGGEWILQDKLQNAHWLDKLLPKPAPLSTMRVITSCEYTLAKHGHAESIDTSDLSTAKKYVKALSAVLRLGRARATTDHTSVLFDVDIASGKVKEGTSNSQWYDLGPDKVLTCPWLPQNDGFQRHPDTPNNPPVTGFTIPDMQKALDIVIESHHNMLPDVPLVGWDVAFCTNGVYLLEVNLSCNFFRGTFDIPQYLSFVDEHFRDLEKISRSKPKNQ
eukprot:GSChrysophyteH1.ASY1.ANO1.1563.1 assembled CDS